MGQVESSSTPGSERGMSGQGWRKSSRCDNNLCVEVARLGSGVAVRDNAIPDVHLAFGDGSWRGLLRDLRDGRFDR